MFLFLFIYFLIFFEFSARSYERKIVCIRNFSNVFIRQKAKKTNINTHAYFAKPAGIIMYSSLMILHNFCFIVKH